MLFYFSELKTSKFKMLYLHARNKTNMTRKIKQTLIKLLILTLTREIRDAQN